MSSGRVRAVVKRQREFRAFAELSHANWVLLENTKEKRDGWFCECMTSILVAAFKFEAYLNHVGAAVFPYWDQMERLPHARKLNILRSHLGIEKTDGERPYQTLADLFRFRDEVAHGKSDFLDPPDEEVEAADIEELRRKKPLTWWEQRCTVEFAERAYEDTEKIIGQIHAAARLDETELHRAGHSYVIRRKKDDRRKGKRSGRKMGHL